MTVIQFPPPRSSFDFGKMDIDVDMQQLQSTYGSIFLSVQIALRLCNADGAEAGAMMAGNTGKVAADLAESVYCLEVLVEMLKRALARAEILAEREKRK